MKVQSKAEKGRRAALYSGLIVMAFFMLIPFAWMVSASLKLNQDIFVFPIRWIPRPAHWENYIWIWQKIPLLIFILNTVKITLIVTGFQLITSSFAAYAFAKMNFKSRDKLFLAYIATIAVPWQVYMVPQYIFMRNLHLNDTHLAIIILQAFSAFGVFLMRQFYMGIPDSLCEAARIDGMSEFNIYSRIMLPLSKPALATLTIFTFVATWNDYLGPTIYLKSESKKTIQIGLQRFIGQYSSEYGLIMAGSVISLIPVLIMFLLLQKYFVEGIATSGVKG